LGKHFAAQLVERGAKVYAAARRPETIELSGVEPVQLDITDPTSVRRAADLASDVTVLINNAGTSTRASLLSGTFEDVRLEMETHYFGTLSVIRAFAPIIEGNGGGAILNMLSVLSWLHAPASGAYSAAKAAEWAMTDALRQELAPRAIHVTAVHVGYMDTDMAAFAPADQKTDPAIVAELALDGLLAGEPEVLADALTRATKAQLSGTQNDR
jgi:NAD(P)-dependent dehydrogenase (short-subunit alcohol dehydrogenase family)